jgi:hypothetical protein
LRTASVLKLIKNGEYFINNLSVENEKWIFKNFKSAEDYAKLFLKLNTTYYAGLPSAVMFRTVGDYLRYALSQSYISEDDLYATDKIVLNKINPYIKKDSKLELLFSRMNNETTFKNDPDDYTEEVFCKSRIVDPLCKSEGKIVRISEVKPAWRETIERESQPKKYFLKFL